MRPQRTERDISATRRSVHRLLTAVAVVSIAVIPLAFIAYPEAGALDLLPAIAALFVPISWRVIDDALDRQLIEPRDSPHLAVSIDGPARHGADGVSAASLDEKRLYFTPGARWGMRAACLTMYTAVLGIAIANQNVGAAIFLGLLVMTASELAIQNMGVWVRDGEFVLSYAFRSRRIAPPDVADITVGHVGTISGRLVLFHLRDGETLRCPAIMFLGDNETMQMRRAGREREATEGPADQVFLRAREQLSPS